MAGRGSQKRGWYSSPGRDDDGWQLGSHAHYQSRTLDLITHVLVADRAKSSHSIVRDVKGEKRNVLKNIHCVVKRDEEITGQKLARIGKRNQAIQRWSGSMVPKPLPLVPQRGSTFITS